MLYIVRGVSGSNKDKFISDNFPESNDVTVVTTSQVREEMIGSGMDISGSSYLKVHEEFKNRALDTLRWSKNTVIATSGTDNRNIISIVNEAHNLGNDVTYINIQPYANPDPVEIDFYLQYYKHDTKVDPVTISMQIIRFLKEEKKVRYTVRRLNSIRNNSCKILYVDKDFNYTGTYNKSSHIDRSGYYDDKED